MNIHISTPTKTDAGSIPSNPFCAETSIHYGITTRPITVSKWYDIACINITRLSWNLSGRCIRKNLYRDSLPGT